MLSKVVKESVDISSRFANYSWLLFKVVNLINGKESIQIEDDFILMNAVGRGARAYGWPVFIPEKFDKPNPR